MAKLAALTLIFFAALLFAFSQAEDPKSAGIFLGEKPESEPETTPFQVKLDRNSAGDGEPVPLTLISFRPVDLRFPRRPFPLAFRRGRRCRHGGHRRDIPYGNDMILSDGGGRAGFDPMLRTGVRPIAARWVEIRHADPGFPLGRGGDVEWPRHHHRRHHHHDHHDEHHDHGNGFLKSFRKFLGHF